MHAFSVHHLIALDLSPDELVESAAELGCPHVCVITNLPGDAIAGVPDIRDEDVERLRRLMSDAQVTPYGIASFPIFPATDIAAYEPGLERGARLGATHANARILDPDEQRAAEGFGAFAERCARLGLLPCIEFTGFRNADALPRALRIIAKAGRGTVSLDMVHVVHSGASWELIQSLDKDLIGYVQLCDGILSSTAEEYEHQQLYDRLPAGDGEFPIAQLLSIVPPDQVLSLEVPCETLRKRGFTGRTLVKEIVQRTRAHLAALGLE